MTFGQDDVLFPGRVGGGAPQDIRSAIEPLPAAVLVLTVLSGFGVLVAVSVLVLLQGLPVDAYAAGLMPGVLGTQNLLVILSVCARTRPPAWFFCLLGAADVVMALNALQFLVDTANETWPSLFNLGVALIWTRSGGEFSSLLLLSKALIGIFLLKAALTVWLGCELRKNSR